MSVHKKRGVYLNLLFDHKHLIIIMAESQGDNSASSPVLVKPGEQTLDFPCLDDLKGQTKAESDSLIMKFGRDSADIIFTFSALIEGTKESLKEQGKTPKDVVDSIGAYKFHGIHRPQLEGTKSIDEIFQSLPFHMSFFKYELLEHIINSLGTDSDNENLKKYLKRFKAYCKCRVFETPHLLEMQQNRRRFVFVTIHSERSIFNERNVDDLIIAKRKIASTLDLDISTCTLTIIDDISFVEMLTGAKPKSG